VHHNACEFVADQRIFVEPEVANHRDQFFEHVAVAVVVRTDC
jgi:hypothetical protein